MMADRQLHRRSDIGTLNTTEYSRHYIGLRQTEVGNSFTVQYTSVILILLTVTVGSFSARHREVPPTPSLPAAPLSPPLAAVALPALFSGNAVEPTEDGLSLIHDLVSRHDIQARLLLPLNVKESDRDFKRLQSMNRAVIDAGIPSELISIELDESIQGAPLLIVENSAPN